MFLSKEQLRRLQSSPSIVYKFDLLKKILDIRPSYLTSEEIGNPDDELRNMIGRIYAIPDKVAIIYDFDETLANVRPVYVFVYMMIQYMLGIIGDEEIDDYDRLVSDGVGSDFFRNSFAEVGGEFDDLHKLVLQTYGVNIHLHQLPEEEDQSMRDFVFRHQERIGGILTTRPSSRTAFSASVHYLEELFPGNEELQNLPIITRDQYRWQMTETNEYKIETLAQIAQETGKALILIDDNDSMRVVVEEYNRSRTANMPPIILIIYKNAEYTDKDWSENTGYGIYASDWRAMEETLSRARSDWNL